MPLAPGSRWVDNRGNVYTCRGAAHGLVSMVRSYREPGTPGVCRPYAVLESRPTPITWMPREFTFHAPAAAQAGLRADVVHSDPLTGACSPAGDARDASCSTEDSQ